MKVSDRVTGAMLVALGVAAYWGGSLLPPVPGQQVGPNVFPMVVGIGLALCGALIAFGVGSVLEQEAEADLAAHSVKLEPEAASSPLLKVVTLVFYPVGRMGDVYLAAALLLGGLFTFKAVQLVRHSSPQRAMRLFGYSISYLTLLFTAMAVDQLVR